MVIIIIIVYTDRYILPGYRSSTQHSSNCMTAFILHLFCECERPPPTQPIPIPIFIKLLQYNRTTDRMSHNHKYTKRGTMRRPNEMRHTHTHTHATTDQQTKNSEEIINLDSAAVRSSSLFTIQRILWILWQVLDDCTSKKEHFRRSLSQTETREETSEKKRCEDGRERVSVPSHTLVNNGEQMNCIGGGEQKNSSERWVNLQFAAYNLGCAAISVASGEYTHKWNGRIGDGILCFPRKFFFRCKLICVS